MRQRIVVLILLAGLVSGCTCSDTLRRTVKTCAEDPKLCEGPDVVPVEAPPEPDPDPDPDPDPKPKPPPPPVCALGALAGRVCAPDQRTWVNGAEVTLTAIDCNGRRAELTTVSGADGSFQLDDIPVGEWTLHAELGSFEHDTQVTVSANETNTLADDEVCVEQKDVRIAVITGTGDKIQDLLTGLSLTFTLYGGESATWASQAAPLLGDLEAMKAYDLIFFNCSAARSSGKIDFGPNAAAIQANLAAYVSGGGSIYASDWALMFAFYPDPSMLDFLLTQGRDVTHPLNTDYLMGYAPQTIEADVIDQGLATFLGKSEVPIAFPRQTGASSVHWGLIEDIAPAVTVLVEGPTVSTCDQNSTDCSSAFGTVTKIPLAVSYKLTPATERGGRVVYTSFHNIAQSGDDVAKILKYLILHL